MKIKMMPMLTAFFLVAALALPSGSQIYAQDAPIDVTDNFCTDAESGLGLCFETVGGAYVVQVYVDETITDPTLRNPATGYLYWPIIDPVAQTKEYRYRASVRGDLATCKGVDTWNYFIQKQSASIADDLVMTHPPGAQLLIPGDSVNKCPIEVFEGEVLLKLNPSLNCSIGNEVIFSLTYTLDVLTGRCNESTVLTKSGCDEETYILGPSTGSLPFHARQYHVTEGGSVEAWFAPGDCGSDEQVQVEEVLIDNEPTTTANPAWVCTPATVDSDPQYVVSIPGFGDMLCIKPEKAGLQYQGCVIDANPRTYLYGGDAYTR